MGYLDEWTPALPLEAFWSLLDPLVVSLPVHQRACSLIALPPLDLGVLTDFLKPSVVLRDFVSLLSLFHPVTSLHSKDCFLNSVFEFSILRLNGSAPSRVVLVTPWPAVSNSLSGATLSLLFSTYFVHLG